MRLATKSSACVGEITDLRKSPERGRYSGVFAAQRGNGGKIVNGIRRLFARAPPSSATWLRRQLAAGQWLLAHMAASSFVAPADKVVQIQSYRSTNGRRRRDFSPMRWQGRACPDSTVSSQKSPCAPRVPLGGADARAAHLGTGIATNRPAAAWLGMHPPREHALMRNAPHEVIRICGGFGACQQQQHECQDACKPRRWRAGAARSRKRLPAGCLHGGASSTSPELATIQSKASFSLAKPSMRRS